MSTTTMHFGPEWMRAKQPHATVRPHAPSPPPTVQNIISGGSPAPQGASSYSALLTAPVPPTQVERYTAHPFKYSRDEILQVWKEGGGRGPLPIEVELWEGVVREKAGEPACLRDLTEAEKKVKGEILFFAVTKADFRPFLCCHHSYSRLVSTLSFGVDNRQIS